MNYPIVFSALLLSVTLSACDKPTVVMPATVVTVPVPGPAGATGATGATGSSGASGVPGQKSTFESKVSTAHVGRRTLKSDT